MHVVKKKDEEKRKDEEHQKLFSRMVASAQRGADLMHKITRPTAWKRGMQVLEELEDSVQPDQTVLQSVDRRVQHGARDIVEKVRVVAEEKGGK